MKSFLMLALISLAACTAPGAKSAGAASEAASNNGATGVVTQENGAPYIDGLLNPVEHDERSLREQDLERIGRQP